MMNFEQKNQSLENRLEYFSKKNSDLENEIIKVKDRNSQLEQRYGKSLNNSNNYRGNMCCIQQEIKQDSIRF